MTSAQSTASTPPSGPPAGAGQSFSGLPAASTGYPSTQLEEKHAVPPLPSYEQDGEPMELQQRIWMKTEMEALGLWPGSRPVRHPMNMISLWRYPPQPELIDTVYELPSPKYFQLHPGALLDLNLYWGTGPHYFFYHFFLESLQQNPLYKIPLLKPLFLQCNNTEEGKHVCI